MFSSNNYNLFNYPTPPFAGQSKPQFIASSSISASSSTTSLNAFKKQTIDSSQQFEAYINSNFHNNYYMQETSISAGFYEPFGGLFNAFKPFESNMNKSTYNSDQSKNFEPMKFSNSKESDQDKEEESIINDCFKSLCLEPQHQKQPRAIKKSNNYAAETLIDQRDHLNEHESKEATINRAQSLSSSNFSLASPLSTTSTSSASYYEPKLYKSKIVSKQTKRQLPLRSKDVDLSNFLNNPAMCNLREKIAQNSSLIKRKHQANVDVDGLSKNKLSKLLNYCSFCENNGEEERIFLSHPLKDSLGKVVCPILRIYKCPKCGESGDYAHTNKYCPKTQRAHKEIKIRKFFQSN